MRNICTVRSYLCGSSRNPGANYHHQDRRRQHADQRHDEQDDAEHASHVVNKGAGVFRRGAGLVLGEYRHERLRERTLAEDAAQEVRDAEGDVEGVGGDTGAGADEPGEHDVAHEAGNARDERHPAGQRPWTGSVCASR